jgi:hypothetical protein
MSTKKRGGGGRYTPPRRIRAEDLPAAMREPMADLIACLDAVAELCEVQREVSEQLRAAVGVGRAAGASWTVLGAKLGVSRQAAQERYGKTSPPKGETEFVVRLDRS